MAGREGSLGGEGMEALPLTPKDRPVEEQMRGIRPGLNACGPLGVQEAAAESASGTQRTRVTLTAMAAPGFGMAGLWCSL